MPILTFALLLIGQSAAAQSVTTPVDGACAGLEIPQSIATIADAMRMAELLRKNCIPIGDPRRTAAEENERRAIERTFSDFVRETCTFKLCLNNGWGFALDAIDDQQFKLDANMMAGCGLWANAVGNEVTASPWKYWQFEEAQYGKDSGMPGMHWVVEATNTRTGQTFVIDGYLAASKARNLIGSNEADPAKIGKKTGVTTPAQVARKYGKRNGGTGCAKRNKDALCDSSKCK